MKESISKIRTLLMLSCWWLHIQSALRTKPVESIKEPISLKKEVEWIYIDDDYRFSLDQHISSGSFGAVYEGEEIKTKEPVAVKVIKTPYE